MRTSRGLICPKVFGEIVRFPCAAEAVDERGEGNQPTEISSTNCS